MTTSGAITKPERATQNRVVSLFKKQLGYTWLGDWEERTNNSNIEEAELSRYLARKGYSPAHISKAIYKLKQAADDHNKTLYQRNKAVYELLRFGITVKTEAGKPSETVQVINWK